MNEKFNTSHNDERNIDWNDVETKISIICRKFNNIDYRYLDDLAQELRIHAYYYSDDYYDLQRKAIDFWRTLTRKVYPEVPYLDLEILAGEYFPNESTIVYKDIVGKIRKELLSKDFKSSREIELDEIANKVLDIIIEDIDGSTLCKDSYCEYISSKYHNGRISISYLDLRLKDVNYKRLVKAVKRLEEIVNGLRDMGLID